MVKTRVVFGCFWLIFVPESHKVACSGACNLKLCFGKAMDLDGNYPQCFSIF